MEDTNGTRLKYKGSTVNKFSVVCRNSIVPRRYKRIKNLYEDVERSTLKELSLFLCAKFSAGSTECIF
jgi:hypothetical protein